MIVKQNGNTILTRWYPTGSYVKETSGGVTKEYTFIGGDAYSAPAVAIKQNGSTSYYSILRDHLGSITHVVNSSGLVVAEYSYDAWGRMRNPATWTNYEPGSEPALMIAGRGYTGHEHLPWFNTINMNGRLYDPLTGMFLSPDNYIQSVENSQNFNRYSYGLNNPLKYSDLSGQLLEPLPNPADAGYPYNPEAATWLANYYMNWDYNYGGGGGGGGVNTVTGLWNSHASTSGILGYRWEGENRIDNATGKIVGVRQNGHYEKVFSQNKGTIYGNRLNNKKDPNLIDEVIIEYEWVWDVPQGGVNYSWGRSNDAISLAGLAWGTLENSLYNGNYWLGIKNLKYNSISWGGNGATGARSLAQSILNQLKFWVDMHSMQMPLIVFMALVMGFIRKIIPKQCFQVYQEYIAV